MSARLWAAGSPFKPPTPPPPAGSPRKYPLPLSPLPLSSVLTPLSLFNQFLFSDSQPFCFSPSSRAELALRQLWNSRLAGGNGARHRREWVLLRTTPWLWMLGSFRVSSPFLGPRRARCRAGAMISTWDCSGCFPPFIKIFSRWEMEAQGWSRHFSHSHRSHSPGLTPGPMFSTTAL